MNILREKAITIKYKRNNEMYVKILRFECPFELNLEVCLFCEICLFAAELS